jgi:hypothetical protein
MRAGRKCLLSGETRQTKNTRRAQTIFPDCLAHLTGQQALAASTHSGLNVSPKPNLNRPCLAEKNKIKAGR